MKHIDLVSGLGRLNRATANLKEQWAEARAHWDDASSRAFEKDHLQQLPSQITLAAAAIHELAEILQQAEDELDEDRTID